MFLRQVPGLLKVVMLSCRQSSSSSLSLVTAKAKAVVTLLRPIGRSVAIHALQASGEVGTSLPASVDAKRHLALVMDGLEDDVEHPLGPEELLYSFSV
jgi:hypothetical protein